MIWGIMMAVLHKDQHFLTGLLCLPQLAMGPYPETTRMISFDTVVAAV